MSTQPIPIADVPREMTIFQYLRARTDYDAAVAACAPRVGRRGRSGAHGSRTRRPVLRLPAADVAALRCVRGCLVSRQPTPPRTMPQQKNRGGMRIRPRFQKNEVPQL